jgi:GNAT superfamily N-acetyltransferase
MQAVQSHTAGTISARTIQDNFITYFRIFAGLPDTTFVEDESGTWIASPAPGSQVMKTNFASNSAATQIDETLRRVGQHVDAIDWMVWPDDQPNNLGEELAERGAAGGPGGEWMLYGNQGNQPGTWLVIDLESLAERVPVAADFHMEQVRNAQQFEVWVGINARGFGSNDYRAFRAAYLRHGFGDDAQAIHFVGFLGDQPVTSSTLLIAGGSASAYNISTPVELRKRGYGSAIIHSTLLAARQRGYPSSWIWSSPMGKSVYQKLGFVITDFGIREYQWKKRG